MADVDGASLRSIAPYYAAFVGLGLAAASIGPTLPALAERSGAPLDDAALLFSAQSLGYLLGTILAGCAYDRLPGHPVLAGVLVWIGAALVAIPSSSALPATIAAVGALGAGMGMLDVGCNTLLVWRLRHRAGPWLNGLHCIFGVGAFLSPIIITTVATATGRLDASFAALAVLLVPALALFTTTESPGRVVFASSGPVPGLDRRFVALGAAFFFVYTGAESATGGWIYTYAVRSGLATDSAGAFLTSTFWGSLAIGRAIAIPAAVRYPPERILAVALPAAVASVAGMLLVPGPVAVWIGIFLVGVSVSAVFPTMLALVGSRTRLTGSTTSLLFASASCGSMFLPWLIGQTFEPFGPASALVVIGAGLAVATILLAVLRAHPRALRAHEGLT